MATDSTGYSSSERISLTRSRLRRLSSKTRSTSFAGTSTRTDCTPAWGDSASVIVFSQCPQLMSGTIVSRSRFDQLSDARDPVILLADSSKFELSAMVRACSLDDVDVFVTDDRLPDRYRKALREHNVEVITVPVEEDHAIA